MESEQRRQKKIADLLALLRDPEIAGAVAKLVEEIPQAAAVPAPMTNGNGHHSTVAVGPTEAIRQVGPEMPERFTVYDLVEKLRERGFIFKRSPQDVVRDSLAFITKQRNAKFRLVEPGKGGRLSKYEFVRD
jgi:hypothetical protein